MLPFMLGGNENRPRVHRRVQVGKSQVEASGNTEFDEFAGFYLRRRSVGKGLGVFIAYDMRDRSAPVR